MRSEASTAEPIEGAEMQMNSAQTSVDTKTRPGGGIDAFEQIGRVAIKNPALKN